MIEAIKCTGNILQEKLIVTYDNAQRTSVIKLLWAFMQNTSHQTITRHDSALCYNGFRNIEYRYPFLLKPSLAALTSVVNVSYNSGCNTNAVFKVGDVDVLQVDIDTDESDFLFNLGFVIDAIQTHDEQLVKEAELLSDLSRVLSFTREYWTLPIKAVCSKLFPQIVGQDYNEFDTDEDIFKAVKYAQCRLLEGNDKNRDAHRLDMIAVARRVMPTLNGYTMAYYNSENELAHLNISNELIGSVLHNDL